jgi:hypothetical protein
MSVFGIYKGFNIPHNMVSTIAIPLIQAMFVLSLAETANTCVQDMPGSNIHQHSDFSWFSSAPP